MPCEKVRVFRVRTPAWYGTVPTDCELVVGEDGTADLVIELSAADIAEIIREGNPVDITPTDEPPPAALPARLRAESLGLKVERGGLHRKRYHGNAHI